MASPPRFASHLPHDPQYPITRSPYNPDATFSDRHRSYTDNNAYYSTQTSAYGAPSSQSNRNDFRSQGLQPSQGPPPPHPPAPPAPPRFVQRPVAPTPTLQQVRPTFSTALRPTFNYYRPSTEYDSQNNPGGHSRQVSANASTEYTSRPQSEETGGRVEQWVQNTQHAGAPSNPSASSGSGPGSLNGTDDEEETAGNIEPSLGADGGSGSEMEALGEDTGYYLPGSEKKPNEQYYPSPHHQQQFAELRREGKERRGGMNLNSLGDGDLGERPKYSMGVIIKCAILGSPRQRLTLNELYEAIAQRFSYYRNVDKPSSWKNSVRHTLSLKQQFIKEPRPITEPGKGHYWVIAPNEPQGNKRERKRNKKLGKRALAAMAAAAAQKEAQAQAHVQAQAQAQAAQQPGPSEQNSFNPLNQHLDPRLADYPITQPMFGGSRSIHAAGTLPASAGSYAAVTGALPTPAPIDVSYLRPWDAGVPTTTVSAYQRASTSQGGPLRLDSSSSSANTLGSILTPDTSFSSSGGPTRTQSVRSHRRYDPLSSKSSSGGSQPQDTFNALAAQIAQEGVGARPSAGGQRDRKGGKRRQSTDEEELSDSPVTEDDDDDGEYRPGGGRKRKTRR